MKEKSLKIFKKGEMVIAHNKDFYYEKNYVEYPVEVIASYKDGTMDVKTRTGVIRCVNQLLFKKTKDAKKGKIE